MTLSPAWIRGTATLLSHVTWPIPPHEDESLVGFLSRTCHHNGLWNTKVLTDDAGIRVSRSVGHLPRLSANLADLASLLAIDPAWVEKRQQSSAGYSGSRVNFHGAALRRVHVDCSAVTIVPSAMLEQGYHREIWLVSTLAASPTTGEVLVQTCQSPGCGEPLCWVGAKGICRCSNATCQGLVPSSGLAAVADSALSGLALAAGLVHPSETINQNALEALPPILRTENRGDLFELAWILGCLEEPHGLKAIMSPKLLMAGQRSEALARGAILMSRWPECLADLLRQRANECNPGQAIMHVVKMIQAVVRKPRTFGRTAAMLAAELDGVTTTAFPTVIGRKLGLLSGRQFAEAVGLKTSKMAQVQRANLFPRILLCEGGRDIALFSPFDASEVRHRIKTRLSAQAFASAVGISIDAVELLVAGKKLQRVDDPLIQALWPELHLDPVGAMELRNSIESAVTCEPAPDTAVELFAALRACPGPERPWVYIIQALLRGRLRLHRKDTSKLNLRRCLISPRDAGRFRSLRVAIVSSVGRSEWLCEADAMERLSTTGQRLRALSDAKKLSISGTYHGQTYRRSEIDAIASGWVSTLELTAKLGVRLPQLITRLSAVGLAADEYKLVPRSAARERLMLASV